MGEEDSSAQSRGECPAVSRTLRRGLVGIAVWVGGGARDEHRDGGPRCGREDRSGGGSSPADLLACGCRVGVTFSRGGPCRPPEALWAELRAGKEGIEGLAEEVASVKDGAWEARGVRGKSRVVDEGLVVGVEGFLRDGGGGGGIALRSSSC